jgi:hypothetical protein
MRKDEDMFLSDEDICRLTGRKRHSAQIRWLRDHGYRFDVNGLKQPIVTAAEVARKLVGGTAQPRTQEPRWEQMHATSP